MLGVGAKLDRLEGNVEHFGSARSLNQGTGTLPCVVQDEGAKAIDDNSMACSLPRDSCIAGRRAGV